MPNRLRRVNSKGKVDVLDRHVRREDQFLAGGDFHQRGVIADAQKETPRLPRRQVLHPGNEFVFATEGRFVTHVKLGPTTAKPQAFILA